MTEKSKTQHRKSPSPRRPIPAHWKEHMDRRGISSVRQLANKADLSQPAANGLVYGDGKRPAEETIAKVAAALDIPLSDAYWLAGQKAPHAETWTPPAEANRMTARQRAALEDLIRAMVDPGERAAAAPAEGAQAPDNVRQLRPSHDVHPEAEGADFAADEAHGLSQGQVEWEDGEEPQA